MFLQRGGFRGNLYFHQKAQIYEKITFFNFCDNFVKNSFFAKMGPGAPIPPKSRKSQKFLKFTENSRIFSNFVKYPQFCKF